MCYTKHNEVKSKYDTVNTLTAKNNTVQHNNVYESPPKTILRHFIENILFGNVRFNTLSRAPVIFGRCLCRVYFYKE